MISKRQIDGGKAFDWGRTSQDYAKYRDIYPQELYDMIASWGVCTKGQMVLDIGTGTGVFPRNMYRFGGKFVGTDISENQIAEAKRLSQRQHMDIEYFASPAEEISFPENTFDVISAFTCFFYFDHERLMPKLYNMLKPGGSLLVGHMAWLPFEDEIACKSEELILKYNPTWSGAGETRRPVAIPEIYDRLFTVVHQETPDFSIPFTRESWNGRMKACRGVGASLSEKEIASFEREHLAMLENYPQSFEISHYAAVTLLKVNK
ncbi:MAG: class I SAM-dependent methyltransferase [Oscillospiraceae bacterium]